LETSFIGRGDDENRFRSDRRNVRFAFELVGLSLIFNAKPNGCAVHGQLDKPRNASLDIPGGRHHEIRQFIDNANDRGKLFVHHPTIYRQVL
jgi:hypothetical protein